MARRSLRKPAPRKRKGVGAVPRKRKPVSKLRTHTTFKRRPTPVSQRRRVKVPQKKISQISAPPEKTIVEKLSDFVFGHVAKNIPEFYQKYLNVDTILGGSYLYAYNVNGRLLIFFGDYHGVVCNKKTAGRAEHLRTFLRDLFTVSKSCVDFFLETTQFSKVSKVMYQPENIDYLRYMQAHHLSDTPEEDEEIEEVFHEFHECFSQERVCKYDTTRFHNFEYRRLLTEQRIKPLVFNKIFTLAEKETDSKKLSAHYAALNVEGGYHKLLEMILTGKLEGVLPFYDRVLSVFHDVPGYFTKNFTVADLHQSMYHLVHKQLMEVPVTLRNQVMHFLRSEIAGTNADFMKKRGASVTSIKVILMDMYALPRLLKSLFTYSDSNIVVCYGGNAHLNRYAKFIEKVIKVRPIANNNDWYSPGYYSSNPDPGCIRTKNVKWVPVMNALKSYLTQGKQGCNIKKFIL